MRLTRLFATTATLAALLFASGVHAGAREDMASFTRGLKGLDGEFTQRVFDANGKLKETSTGKVAVSAPRQFRWEYLTPYPQLIVADGRTVWIYDPDLAQVTRRPQGVEEQNNPLGALVDPSRLDAQFTVTEAGQADGLSWLTLSPKDAADASFSSARLGFRGGALARMSIVDTLGQRTEIEFSPWTRNPGFAKGTFSYTPPEDVDVIGEG
ncbi:outer membrane lipoprotein chaperone LolA [Marilutibacter chinensis]|uniref:Outer-membrane lipoprotein carrier protein n=1 Tax=Marilutibacter chinensis TaxID=2912247 RepID=A0ABS9HQ28_9GAMM|nr:outer membrane lipoprotein chaperone LolA [Lysobacter chinensis]MCF7220339.1 outer membrane lipoprotein chaperone LolA [Lysobacter chinensis]